MASSQTIYKFCPTCGQKLPKPRLSAANRQDIRSLSDKRRDAARKRWQHYHAVQMEESKAASQQAALKKEIAQKFEEIRPATAELIEKTLREHLGDENESKAFFDKLWEQEKNSYES